MFIGTNKIQKLWECRSGNFAMMTALAILPFIAMLGGAVDVSRAVHARAVLQKATEAAALSAASLTNDDDIQTIVEDYVAANLPEGDIWDTLQISILTSDVEHASREIAIQTTVNIDSTFLHIAGVNDMTITTESTALQKATKLEIAMVLDISSSMRGTKLENLKTAATEFVDEVKQNNDYGVDVVSFNLIPYGGTVNVGNIFDDYVLPLDTPDLIVDPTKEEYSLGADILNSPFRFTDGLECIEHPYEDYNDEQIPFESRTQVPHFYRWFNTNPWCPTAESAAVFNVKDTDELNAQIDAMTLSDGTGTDIGLLWGVKSLSPEWRGKLGGDFENRPADYDDPETMKIMILMTDGGITRQFRPKKEHEDGLDDIKGNQQTIVTRGSFHSAITDNNAYGRQKRLCEELEQNGVKVFTIGFQISEGGQPAMQMAECAVNGGNYYLVDSLDISQAFESISASISNLRVSG